MTRDTRTVTVERQFAATPERVFDAWLDPEGVGSWLFRTQDGVPDRVEVDPRVGGGFRVDERRGDDIACHYGEYLEIDRPRGLVFEFSVLTFGNESPTRVTVEVAPVGTQACELTITHDMGTSSHARAMEEASRRGWQNMLGTLERELFPRRIGIQL